MTPAISVIHPTARVVSTIAFPLGWEEAERHWFATAADPASIEYILAIHESRWEEAWAGFGRSFSPWLRTVLVCNRRRDCCVDQANAAVAASSGDILVVMMDDLFAPPGWDQAILQAIPDPHREAVLHCSSGSPDDYRLFIPQIFTRARYERLGYVGHPDYEGMFVDREFTDHARQDEVAIQALQIVFEHRHPRFGFQRDAVHEQENRPEAYQVGRAVYERRKAAGFPPLS